MNKKTIITALPTLVARMVQNYSNRDRSAIYQEKDMLSGVNCKTVFYTI